MDTGPNNSSGRVKRVRSRSKSFAPSMELARRRIMRLSATPKRRHPTLSCICPSARRPHRGEILSPSDPPRTPIRVVPEVHILLRADRVRVHATSDSHESGERCYSYLTITAGIDSPNRTLASSLTQDCEDSEQYILADPQPRSHEVLDGSTRGLPVQDLPPMCLQYDRCRPARLDPAHPRTIDGYTIVHQVWDLQCFSQGDGIRFSSAHRGSSAEGFRSRPISPS